MEHKDAQERAPTREIIMVRRNQNRFIPNRRLTPFQKRLREVAGKQIDLTLSNHARKRFVERMGMTYKQIKEQYGDPSVIKMTIPQEYAYLNDVQDPIRRTIDFETMTFQIIQARAKFIIAWDVDEEGKETWTAITFYWMSRA